MPVLVIQALLSSLPILTSCYSFLPPPETLPPTQQTGAGHALSLPLDAHSGACSGFVTHQIPSIIKGGVFGISAGVLPLGS